MYMVSFTIGLIIVISSLFLMRNELNRAIKKQEQIVEQTKLYKEGDLFNLLEALQISIDEMNRAFYEIADDLEGKYSTHEKEINDLISKVEDMKSSTYLDAERAIPNETVKDIQTSLSRMQQQFDQKNRGKHPNRHLDSDFEPSEWLSDGFEESDVVENSFKVPSNQMNKTMQPYENQELETIDKIILLRSQGKSLTQIAKELGVGMGEIQLLLSLKK
ncbi:MAG: hypothetical protein BGO41_13765 [Clostridiales bacterium 38-18]|nr:MAG: hypothetical protein BGO41_13765 [Clostridiales bacterium 38-18]